jgi:hypothetical protein
VLFYQEAEYDSELLSFAEEETSKSVELIVYDATASDEAIKVMMAHTVMYVEEGSLQINEYYLLVNTSDRTYIGSKEVAEGGANETLAFVLPENATDLQPTVGFMQCCIYGSADGFVDTMPVLPGAKELAYSYRVSYDSGEYAFSRKMNYPTINYDLLVQSGMAQIISDQLTPQESLEISGTQFNHFSGSDFSAGDILVTRLSDLPGADNQMPLTWMAIALMVLILVSGSVYILRRRKLQPVRSESSPEERQQLLLELAQLDDEFDSGKIREDVYHKLRAEKKSQLATLMQRQEKSSGNK